VLFVVGGVGLYFAYERLFKPGLEIAGSVKELGRLHDIEKQVRNTGEFDPPAGGELTQAMVERFVRVQKRVEDRMGPKLDALKAKRDQIDRSMSGEKSGVSFRDVASGLKGLTVALLDAKAAQVEALNQERFSVKEYEWVRDQVYAAVGIEAVGFDMKELAERVKAGDTKAFDRREKRDRTLEVPERNKALVAPYEKPLKEWAALAFFGL
jgi:hypothetical protein